jgi:hypothetical protein
MLTINLVDFKDPSRLTIWVKRLSYFGIFVSILALFAGCLEYNFYQGLSDGLYSTEDIASIDENFKDKWLETAGIFQISVLLQMIAFFMWVYRINSNTHALRVVGMKFTPGWAVGWFFVPLASLWKPYQVLKEIWNSNHFTPIEETGIKKNATFIKWFWLFTLLSNHLAGIEVAKWFTSQELPQLMLSNKLTMISDFMDIPSFIMTIILVERIYKAQMLKFEIKANEYQQLINPMPYSDSNGKKQTKPKWTKRCLFALLGIFIIILIAFLLLIWIEPLLS